MALRRKPEAVATQDERRIDELIEKGGSVATVERPRPDNKLNNLQLRLPQAIVNRIDQVRQLRTVAPPRHAWLLEAILEKLAREEQPR